jgi:hypothetical protein
MRWRAVPQAGPPIQTTYVLHCLELITQLACGHSEAARTRDAACRADVQTDWLTSSCQATVFDTAEQPRAQLCRRGAGGRRGLSASSLAYS